MTKIGELKPFDAPLLGAALRQLRAARGLTQADLGRRLGLSLQQIQKYESGANRMAASTAFRAAEILGVEIGALYAPLAAAGRGRAKAAKADAVALVPLAGGRRGARAREAELLDLARRYQELAAADRALVRGLVRRLGSPARAGRSAADG